MSDTFPIFDKLGGEAKAIAVIQRRMGWKPSAAALKKWIWQRSISYKVGLELAAECSARKIRFDTSDIRLKQDQERAA